MRIKSKNSEQAYKNAGVDIEAGDKLVRLIRPLAQKTKQAGVASNLGGFGACFDLKETGLKDPILVAGTDGVGTKLSIAIESGVLDTVGIDLVAMCVNDVLAQGALPLFFLDYYACGKLCPEEASQVISGITNGCLEAKCALIGGETAEMPGFYRVKDFDLAGFVVGAAERNQTLPKMNSLQSGDAVIGLKSSGPHANGYSLIRKIYQEQNLKLTDPAPFDSRKTLAEALLIPTKIYVKTLEPLLKRGIIKAAAHITGGGLIDNPPRMLPENLQVQLEYNHWPRPAIFNWLQEKGNLTEAELFRTFNAGIGFMCIVPQALTSEVLETLNSEGENAFLIGKVIEKA